MAFKIISLAGARNLLTAVGKAVFPDRNYGNEKSYHSRRATFLAAAVTQINSNVFAVQNDVMPDKAGDGAPINRWGAILGVKRKSATPARRVAAGRVFGSVGADVDVGEELIHEASNLRFRIGTSTVVSGGGSIDVDIVAIDTGSKTRLAKGQVLRFVTTPVGLQTRVPLVLALDEDGYDDEPFGSYRERVLAALSEPTSGGSQADYVEWMLEVEGVTGAYAFPNRAGIGTVDLVGLHTGSGGARILSSGEIDELLAYVRERAPSQIAGDGGSLRHLDVEDEPQDVEVLVSSNGEAAYAFDWSSPTPPQVAAYDAATRKVTLNADRPTTMKAGHRVVFKGIASAQDGKEFTIEALGAGDDEIILEAAPDVDLAATDLVYSGGPLVTPIRDAIVAHMNGETVYAGRGRIPLPESSVESTVGLEVIARGIGPANPGGKYGAWTGDLLRSVLFQLAMSKAGIRNAQITTPATDVSPTNYSVFDDDRIAMIVPGRVLVREG